jgi:F-type H+-transporting ATPase subunit delta
VDVSESASTASGIAGRYALAVFDLVKESNGIKALEADVGALEGALKDSAEFRDLISSPVYSREDQAGAVSAIAGER